MKFTFKTNKPTGRYKSFYNESHDIKLRGKVVGSIGHDSPYKIRLMIIKKDVMEDGNKNCDWKLITLKKENASLQEAKDWINEKFDSVNSQYNLKMLD